MISNRMRGSVLQRSSASADDHVSFTFIVHPDPMNDGLAVEATDLTKQFGAVTALAGVSIAISHGEVYGLLGPNGAGKTTFLRMLFGLVRPDTGTLRVLGRSWPSDGVATLTGVGGFVESPRFYPYLSARRNLQVLARLDGNLDHSRITEVLEVVELHQRADHRVAGYSFGMRQRLGVAAALLRSPSILVLDEPANGLDPAGIRDMRALVKRLAAGGLTVLLSSHDMSEVEEICDNVTIMQAGVVRFHGSMAALHEQAPPPAFRLRTSDDRRAQMVPVSGGAVVLADPNGLTVQANVGQCDAYVLSLARQGIAVRSLGVTESSLTQLFFQLTEPVASVA
jgi:ABC-2 type transport system ATP-binding protein